MSDVLRITIKGLIAGFLVLSSCEEEFTPNIVVEPIPVVYGIINPDDSIYCVRVTKTFLCDQDVRIGARQPNIQYFTDADVEFELLSMEEELLNRGTLKPLTIDDKSPGLFSQSPNIVYAINRAHFEFEQDATPLGNPSNAYLLLKIKTSETSLLTYSRVELRRRPRITNPYDKYPRMFSLFDQYMEKVNWMGFPDQFHSLILRINYLEQFMDSTGYGQCDIEFPVDPLVEYAQGPDYLEYSIDGMDFLRKMKIWFNNKPMPRDLEYRKITALTIVVVSINDDYRTYLNSLNQDSDFETREVSNVINGIGLFAVKRIGISSGHSFSPKTMDSIANSSLTRNLKFVKW